MGGFSGRGEGFPTGGEEIVVGVVGFRDIGGEGCGGDEGARLAGRLPGDGAVVGSGSFLVEDLDVVKLAGLQRDRAAALGGVAVEIG